MQFVTWFSGAYSRIYRNFVAPRRPYGGLRGPLRGACARVALRATDAEPLINALVYSTARVVCSCSFGPWKGICPFCFRLKLENHAEFKTKTTWLGRDHQGLGKRI